MNLRIAALIFGIAFLGAGVVWHMPFLFSDGMLFGLFNIDSMHNKVHIASGLIALAATYSAYLSRLYFRVFGTFYTILGVLGFFFETQFLGMDINQADNLLHVVIGAIALFIGFNLKMPKKE